MTKQKPRVALVLSSGGARGMAHIGVIDELLRLGFEITSVSGTSIGSLIGAVYASGQLDEFRRWIVDLDKLDIFRLVDFSIGTGGFIKGDRVFKAIEDFIPDRDIRDLKIPYAAVAADIVTGDEIVFREGSMYRAIKASCAIPTVMLPRTQGRHELVDGGVVNPIPIDIVQRQPGDILVVVNLNARIPYSHPKTLSVQQIRNDQIYTKGLDAFRKQWQKLFHSEPQKEQNRRLGYFELMSRSFDLVQDELCEHIIEKSNPDILVKISRNACSTFDFHRADELIAEGRRALNYSLAWKMIHDQKFKV